VGAKALYRSLDGDGLMGGDVLALEDEPPPPGSVSLLQAVMRGGELLRPHPPLSDVRRHCAAHLASLPQQLRRLRGHAEYAIRPSPALRARQDLALGLLGTDRGRPS
jgi:hypothetical protein